MPFLGKEPSPDLATTGDLGDDIVTLAKLASGTDGNIISYDSSGNPVAIATGNDGQVLTSAGAGAQPAFETLSAGKVLQAVNASIGTIVTGTTTFPEDDTKPQNTEGNEAETVSITPTAASSTLYIYCTAFVSLSSNARCGIALFKDSGADALAYNMAEITNATTMDSIFLQHAISAGSTSAQTFKIRVGSVGASGTVSVNGQSGSQKFGGVCGTSMHILEVGA